MTLDGESSAYLGLYDEAIRASGDRACLKRIRRRVRRSAELGEDERADLLEHAKWIPGCVARPFTLNDDGTTRPMTDSEVRKAYGP